MNVCISFSFLWEGSVYPFPSSLGWRSAAVPLLVLLHRKKRLSWSCSFSRSQLSGVPHSFNYALLLWHQSIFIYFIFFNLLLPFCVPSPHLHLGFHPSRQASRSCPKRALRSCLCLLSIFSLGCLQFSWTSPDLLPAVSSSGEVLLKHSCVSHCCCN